MDSTAAALVEYAQYHSRPQPPLRIGPCFELYASGTLAAHRLLSSALGRLARGQAF